MLDLASRKAGHFEPARFEDQYEDALKELLKKKQSGQKIEAPREREPSKVVNLMDALRPGTGRRRDRMVRAGGFSGRHSVPIYSLCHISDRNW
jgi:DNA end-binding protein Ku